MKLVAIRFLFRRNCFFNVIPVSYQNFRINILRADAIMLPIKTGFCLFSSKILSEMKKLGKAKYNVNLACEILEEPTTRLEGSFGKEMEHYNL